MNSQIKKILINVVRYLSMSRYQPPPLIFPECMMGMTLHAGAVH
jgi:hypothetical protein